jgi:hypothetical protein
MKKLYLYTTSSDREKNYYKFGETIRCAESRIKNQQTGNSEKLEMICDVDSEYSDHFIHNELEKLGYYRVSRGGTEWFGGFKSDDEAIASLLKIVRCGSNTTLRVFKPRFYQDYIKMVFINKLESDKNEKKEFALELAPRFGKTLWTLDLMLTLFNNHNYKIALLPAFVLTALSSFEKEFYQYKSFVDNMIFVRENDNVEDIIKENYGKKMIILPISLHTSNYVVKYKYLIKLPNKDKVSFIDESDFGCYRKNSQDFIKYLNCGLDVYMTGTGIDKVVSPLDHIGDNIIRWSYTDMMMVKSGEHPIQKIFL